MNAIDLLKNDHDYVDMLFGRIEETPPSRHAPIFKRIKNELDTHAHIEEKLFYPKLKAEGDKELKDLTMEALQEHAQMKKFLAEISRSTSKDNREAKLKVLIEDTRHHVKEEENEMFPMVEDQFSSEELDRLGKRMEAEKLSFQRTKRIPARRAEPKGAFTNLVEKAKAAVASVVEPSGGRKVRSSSRPANGRSKAKSSSGSRRSPGRSRASHAGASR